MENTKSLLSGTDVALLGLLTEAPMHPWEIRKQVEYRDMGTWAGLARPTVYKVLESLEDRGYVTSAESIVQGRVRRTYSVTETGRKAMSEAVCQFMATPEYPRWSIDIAIYNANAVDSKEAVAALDQYSETLVDRARGWAALEDFLRAEGCSSHRWALARRARAMIAGELEWVQEFRTELAGT